MADKRTQLKEILDFVQLRKLLGHFTVVTGLDVGLFDVCGVELLSDRKAATICRAAKNCRKCREMIAYGGVMSSKLGEPYIFACGCGFIMCSSPVMFNDQLSGSIVCGPVLPGEVDGIALSAIMEKTGDMGIRADDFLRHTPSCNSVNVTSAAQILFIIVNSLTHEHNVYLKQRERITEQQRRISELVQDRKFTAAGLIEMEKRASALAYPYETEKELIAFVQNGNKQQATNILNILLSIIFCIADGNIDTIRVRIFELVAFLSRAAVEAGAPLREVNSITKTSFEICEDSTDFERLCFLTTQAMERFIDTVHQNRGHKQTSEHLSKAIGYISQNYAKDLSLSAVASRVFVSEYYLSHLFRKEMNMTFSNYVCRIRIDKAKEFLKNDRQAQIQEVAGKVGFNDANYFAKIFKKTTGITPKEYHSYFCA
ncbi:MAG: PocR ligand-binding domain-containing protein [Treponema sp.]|jgi:two-component system response regulator YesN|nr:PocR ligand-binding domain-containing protein [Treponema sp.]